MAATASPKLTYAFSYGFVGGPLHAKLFKRLMDTAGFEQLKDIRHADIIIAHSAGCWLIPPASHPKLVIYVGMPLAQNSPSQSALAQKREAKLAGKPRRWSQTKKNYYLLAHFYRNLRIVRMSKLAKAIIFPGAETVFITNRHDPWPRDAKLDGYVKKYGWAFIGVPGGHDDIWHHPERYVEIIKRYAGLLAKTNA